MLKNKFGKKAVAAVMAAAMTVSATAMGLSSITASAAATGFEEFGAGTFNDGVGLPWHICESATGTMKFEVANGSYNILITNPGGLSNNGEGRWDCQFRHRGLTIEAGHTYRYTYSIWSNKDAKIYCKLGDITDDDLENWHQNGDKLQMDYDDSLDDQQLTEKLKSASKTGEKVDFGMGWDSWKNQPTVTANKWTTYAWEFTAEKDSKGTAEMTFHLGGTSAYNDFICCEAGTLLKFDNLALVDMTDDKSNYNAEAAYQPTGVEVNQVGYYPLLEKKATLILDGPDTTAKDFQVKDSSGAVVYEGKTDASRGGEVCDGSETYNQIIDFSDFQTEGTGYTITCDGKTSLPFDIGNNIYDGMTTNAMNYFYQNRSGVNIDAAYITSQGENSDKSKLARKAGHNPDTAYIQNKWVYIIPDENSIEKNNGTIDVTGGWYDAGDHGKYVVNGGVSMWTLLNLYESDLMAGDASKWADGSGTVVVPETGNSMPDILDEVKIEADFFKKMQRSDGMVYHKIHDYKWTALCVAPADDELTRIVKPVTYAATLNFAAAMAQYARLAKDYDQDASGYLADAEKAYKAAKASYKPFSNDWGTDQYADLESLYAPIAQNKGGGPYGDTDVEDEFYWAACELYIATGDASYKTDLEGYSAGAGAYGVDTALYGGENNGTRSSFTWGTLASLGTFSLCVNAKDMQEKGLLSAEEVSTIQKNVKQAADYFIDLENQSDFGIPYVGHDYNADVWSVADYEAGNGVDGVVSKELKNGYEWGSNSMVMNNAITMALAYDIDHEAKYINGVSTAMDYILGRNVIEQSYVTGYGEHCLKYPHHRWWSGQLDAERFPYAPDGVLSGGPNSQMQDPMIQGAGYKAGSLAPMACYLDNVEAWSVNECTINWNSPLVWIASFLEDEAPNVNKDTDVTTTTTTDPDSTTTTTTTVATTTASGETTAATTAASGATTTTAGSTTDVDPNADNIGDVNLDGVVDILDAVMLNKYLAGVVQLSDQAYRNANCDQSADDINNVGEKDTTALVRFVLNMEGYQNLPHIAE